MLMQHKIDFYHLQANQTIDNQLFVKGYAVIIPTDQPQYLLIRSIFDKPKTFADSSFYDASTWNLAYAYGLAHSEIKQTISTGEKITKNDLLKNAAPIEKLAYGYLIDWRDYNVPKFLYELQKRGIVTKVSYKSFKINNKDYGKGTLLVQSNIQKIVPSELLKTLNEISNITGITVDAIATGFSQEGVDSWSWNSGFRSW
jgi:hypothetical protein